MDGTTLDEVARYHRDTLKLVVETVNQKFDEIEREREQLEASERARVREHEETARRKAREIKFD